MLIALLSLAPTFAFARWRKQLRHDAHAVPAPAEVGRVRRWVLREAHLPVFAALMARGIGSM